ncbi:hypothetical protein JXQ70_19225 [bacterium]|nr:hypothetical protein [bacterium]
MKSARKTGLILCGSIVIFLFCWGCVRVGPGPNETASVIEDNGPAFSDLVRDQVVGKYIVKSVYLNKRAQRIGGRFIHQPTGMPVDILRMETVPQMLVVVSTLPTSDKGEPHTGEHLVLGKGSKGLAMSLAMDMMLGSNSAGTSRDVTSYHFQTIAGKQAYFTLMQKFLDTLINPDFTEEEIRREVCHLGVSHDPVSGAAFLDEKGTIYNEMISSCEKPDAHVWHELIRTLYGPGHALAYISGGEPTAIRAMTPADIELFHSMNYQFGPTMNAVLVIPPEISLGEMLEQFDHIVQTIMKDDAYTKKHGQPTAMTPFQPDPDRDTVRIVSYPGQPGQNEGFAYLAWPPFMEISPEDILTIELIFGLIADGEASYLYRDLVNCQTRQIEPGPTEIVPFTHYIEGYPVFIYLGGFPENMVQEGYLTKMRGLIEARFQWLAGLEDNSDELDELGQRFKTLLNARERSLRRQVEENPGFGHRNTGNWWYWHLKNLNHAAEFELDLIPSRQIDRLRAQLDSGRNFYRDYLQRFGFLDRPYLFSAQASEHLIEAQRTAKQERMAQALLELMQRFGVETETEALTRFSEEIALKTRELEDRDKTVLMPSFTADPPLVYDPGINYETETLEGNVPVVWTEFESLTFHDLGLHFNVYDLPETYLPYLGLLPELLNGTGVKDRHGLMIGPAELEDRLRNEINYLNFVFEAHPERDRLEMSVFAGGGSVEEGMKAMEWLENCLFRPLIVPENCDRINDLIDRKLSQLREIMQYPEEYWSSDMAQAVYYQHDPHLMAIGSIWTQIHALERLKWKLVPVPQATERPAWENLCAALNEIVLLDGFDRALLEQIGGELDGLTVPINAGYEFFPDKPRLKRLGQTLIPLLTSETAPVNSTIVTELITALTSGLSQTNEVNQAHDLQTMIAEFGTDLWTRPEITIGELEAVRQALLAHCQVRVHFTSNSADRLALEKRIKLLVERVVAERKGPATVSDHKRGSTRSKGLLLTRLVDRYPELAHVQELPHCLAIVKKDTQNTLLMNRAPGYNIKSMTGADLKKHLALSLYGGSGAHGVFMQTWGQGLAYSNALYSSVLSGHVHYYAERCNDPVATMSFVTGLLEKAPQTLTSPYFLEYALAYNFGSSLTGSDYFTRGRAMAEFLADGFRPELIRQYRSSLLSLRDQENILPELVDLLPEAAGRVVVGYGAKAIESPDTTILLIGPEFQIENMEKYLNKVEGPDKFYRIYPRDFWSGGIESVRSVEYTGL